jgi:uncharacterized protein HemY
MKRALAVILGVVMVCLVAYLSWLNPAAVEFRLTPARSIHAPLSVLVILAFVVGLLLVFMAVLIQAGRRALVAWWQGRQQRRDERIENWQERGSELIWRGETQQGRVLLQKAWQHRPEDARALLVLADSFCDTGEFRRAAQLLADAANRDEADPDILLALAHAHRCDGDRAAGVAVLERLHALRPNAPRALRALLDAHIEGERWTEAAGLQEALVGQVRDPTQVAHERARLAALRYQVAVHVDDLPGRVQALEGLADSRAGSVPLWVSLGDAFLASERRDEASLVWERALRTQARTVLVERLASIATENRHRERLRNLMRKLRSDQVRPDMVRLLTAQLYLEDGDTDQAARELDALQDPANVSRFAQRLRAEIYRQRGNLEEAVSAYAKAPADDMAYRCTVCDRRLHEWSGYCVRCHSLDSYRSEVEIGLL